MRRIAAADAAAMVHGEGEVAFLDVREAGPFSEGHPLFAVPAAWSRLEETVPDLVPRADVPVILVGGAGDDVADRAAAALGRLGYRDVRVVDGGVAGWAAAGERLYEGVNVPSKTLGELAEEIWHPATIDAPTLARWRAEGRAFHFFDARPADEYAKMRVPGARCLPNGELAHRFPAVVRDEAPVVITCAGRTRGIVGALGILKAGIGREVFALENGTQGWVLAGETLERGNAADPFPDLSEADAAATRERAEAFMAREGIERIGADEAARRLAEAGRTTFAFDVRSPAEAAADPLPAFLHAPSGQLPQATDRWVGVLRARILLADDLGLRAAITAYWLRLLGHDVAVVEIDHAVRRLPARTGGPDRPALSPPPSVGAAEALAGGARLVDVRPSAAFRAGHVRGAVWSDRARVVRDAPGKGEVILVADDAFVAATVAGELAAAGRAARVVEGGHDALAAAGAAIEAGEEPSAAVAGDATTFAAGRHDGNLDASRLYLSWEQALVGQLSDAERAQFRIP